MDSTMRVKLLPSSCIIKNYVGGEDNCNYEIYLLELLNQSVWFAARYPGTFKKAESEAHGECDAINSNYQIDFKLLASKTALQARGILQPQIYKDQNGVIFHCESRNPGGMIQVTRLYAALRGKSLADLYCIRQKGTKAHGIENDIFTMLKMLETKKNLLLFFPYNFTFDKPHQYEEAAKSISEALTQDFCVAFEYRDIQIQNKYDTLLTCFYKDSFLVFSWNDQKMRVIDNIGIEKMPTFLNLYRYADMWG